MEQLVTTREAEQQPYILLEPGNHPARTGPNHGQIIDWRDIDAVIQSASQSEIVAVDFETTGLDYSDPAVRPVGIGMSWDKGSIYLPLGDLYQSSLDKLYSFLNYLPLDCYPGARPKLIAHNVYFDGGIVFSQTGKHAEWKLCTSALLSLLANEGYPGQSSGLKTAQIKLLGWTETNETELDEWLVSHGFYIGNKLKEERPEALVDLYRQGKLRPNKSEMWRAPNDILGKYCALDAESTYLLYTRVLEPVYRKFPDLVSFVEGDFLYLIRLLIEQKMHGIPISRPGLEARKQELLAEMSNLEKKFREDLSPEITNYIKDYERSLIRAGLLDSEPPRTKKDGTSSKAWANWKERYDRAEAGELADYRFNIQSGDQLRPLLYDLLGNPVRITTPSGEPATSVKALKHMGPPGQLLIEQTYLKKELGFIDDYLERTEKRASIHPSFRCPGTMTGRLSSREPNFQQIPKTKKMMSLFQARPGHVWIDLDFSALEPVVATEFSGDKNMMKIYGNSAPKNDIYMFVGAHIPGMDRKFREAGYDPYNPTGDGLANAKKVCKAERSVCKTVVLACQYGAGVNKVMQTLENDDIFLPHEEVEKIHSGYWNLFSGVKEFSRKLYREWRDNRGFIMNGLGRPMCVPEDMTKDLLNRFIQSTGHDILVKYISLYVPELNRRSITWYPLCMDWHDASCIEVPEDQVEQATEVMLWGIDELNRQLGGVIKLRGEPDIGRNLADVKKPEE